MSEQKYESKIQSIPAPVEKVFPVLSNLKNLERVRDLIPQDKVQEMDVTEDAGRTGAESGYPHRGQD